VPHPAPRSRAAAKLTIAASPKLGPMPPSGRPGFSSLSSWDARKRPSLGCRSSWRSWSALPSGTPGAEGVSRNRRERLLEGDDVRLAVTITSTTKCRGCRSPGRCPRAWRQLAAETWSRQTRCERTRDRETVLTTKRWGVVSLPEPLLRAHDELGSSASKAPRRKSHTPRLPSARETPARVHRRRDPDPQRNELSRVRGDGIEFADIGPTSRRPAPAHQWRLSARTGQLHINQCIRSATPTSSSSWTCSVTSLEWRGTLDYAVRAAASLASTTLARRDRGRVIALGASCAG